VYCAANDAGKVVVDVHAAAALTMHVILVNPQMSKEKA
jgi:hypothetical protein